jgi:hypothetical protein
MPATSLALTVAFVALAAAAEPDQVGVDISGGVEGRGLVVAESDKPVYRLQLTARVDKNGAGKGTLVLDPTQNAVDEFGFPEVIAALPPVKLECSLKLVKKKKLLSGRGGAPPAEVEWRLFEITGPKITTRLALATEGDDWSFGRFIVSDKDGKERVAVSVRGPIQVVAPPPPPCHPGCFPAGTPIHVPGGTKAVDGLRVGDVVTTVGPDGAAGEGKVAAVFVTKNRLIEVRTEGKTLVTTEKQPLTLAGGGLRAAGKLKEGDRVAVWDGRERKSVAVKSVAATGREEKVFNLILGEGVLFVADGFLARSKPPAVK